MNALAFSSDQQLLLSASSDSTIRLWSTELKKGLAAYRCVYECVQGGLHTLPCCWGALWRLGVIATLVAGWLRREVRPYVNSVYNSAVTVNQVAGLLQCTVYNECEGEAYTIRLESELHAC